MGKRKRHSEDNYDYIARKLKKLERKLKRGQRRRTDSDSSKSTTKNAVISPISMEDGPPNEVDSIYIEPEAPVEPFLTIEPVPSTSIIEPVPSTSAAGDPVSTEQTDIPPTVSELDSEIMEILGDDPSAQKTYGKDIQSDLALRLEHILTTGLPKDIRKELQERYLPPGNCTLIDAPSLNPEIKAAISDITAKKDKGIETKQKQLGCAISSLSEALTILLSQEKKDTTVIKLLMDTNRLLCDCHNSDSVMRRNFILYGLKKDMKDQIQTTKIDKLLFGKDLAETLKMAKSISKSGAELKSTPAAKASANRPKPASNVAPTRNNLNWKAPPLSRRPKGTQRAKEPVQKERSTHANFSRPSHRAPPPSRSRR